MPPFSPALESGSPPFPRETILDRAFQLRYIPGSDQQIPGEEKLSSLARFEALMQQADEQRKLREQRENAERPPLSPPVSAQQPELKSAWDLDEDTDEAASDAESADIEGDSGYGRGRDVEDRGSIRPTSRVLEYVSGRQTPQSHLQSPRSHGEHRSPIGGNQETTVTLNRGSNLGRSPIQVRPRFAQRNHSQPSLAGRSSTNLGVSQSALAASPGKSSIASGRTSIHEEHSGGGLNPAAALYRTSTIAEGQHRHSPAGKRLSISDSSRRRSSTGSQLLVQASRDDQTETHLPLRPAMQPRGPPPLFDTQKTEGQRRAVRDASDQKCSSWRNGVGAFEDEGGFL